MMGRFRLLKGRDSYSVDEVQLTTERVESNTETRFCYTREVSSDSDTSSGLSSAESVTASTPNPQPKTSKPKVRKHVTWADDDSADNKTDDDLSVTSSDDVIDQRPEVASQEDVVANKMFTERKHRRAPSSWILGGNLRRSSLDQLGLTTSKTVAA